MRLRNKGLNRFLAIATSLSFLSILSACKDSETPVSMYRETVPQTTPSPVVKYPIPSPGTMVAENTNSPATIESSNSVTPDVTLGELIAKNDSFSMLRRAIEAAGLQNTLNDGGPYTFFAPTDAAFAALPEDTLKQLLFPENRETLRQILMYHLVPGGITAANITSGELTSLAGAPLTIANTSGQVIVAGAVVIQPDIIAKNGIIHAVDKVLIPSNVNLQ